MFDGIAAWQSKNDAACVILTCFSYTSEYMRTILFSQPAEAQPCLPFCCPVSGVDAAQVGMVDDPLESRGVPFQLRGASHSPCRTLQS